VDAAHPAEAIEDWGSHVERAVEIPQERRLV
jgi:hypothetical protein